MIGPQKVWLRDYMEKYLFPYFIWEFCRLFIHFCTEVNCIIVTDQIIGANCIIVIEHITAISCVVVINCVIVIEKRTSVNCVIVTERIIDINSVIIINISSASSLLNRVFVSFPPSHSLTLVAIQRKYRSNAT